MDIVFEDATEYISGIESDIAKKEISDCFVMALAICTSTEYDEAHKLTKEVFKRETKLGVNVNNATKIFRKLEKKKLEISEKFFDIKVLPLSRIQKTVKINGMRRTQMNTLKSFIVRHRKGCYFILVSGHAMALKDGVFYDVKEYMTNRKLLRRVHAAIKITPYVEECQK